MPRDIHIKLGAHAVRFGIRHHCTRCHCNAVLKLGLVLSGRLRGAIRRYRMSFELLSSMDACGGQAVADPAT